MLYIYRDELLLIELKVEPFYQGTITQMSIYETNSIDLQEHNKT